uniref:tigger transposable element-derived protein 1-like n=1 Tax=Myxine glutinosa TaxID=7769 RepID=UPI00358E955F
MSTTKRQKKVMNLSQKVELLDLLLRGDSAASVGRHYGVHESTIRYIRKNEKAIRESVLASAVLSMTVVTHVRNVHVERMEKAFNIWIEDNMQKNMPLSGPLIREKAKQIYDHLSGAGGASTSDEPSDDGTISATSFTASRGWFHRFKEQYCLKNVKLSGERASVDHEAAKAFPAQLTRLIKAKGYLQEQVFNADKRPASYGNRCP